MKNKEQNLRPFAADKEHEVYAVMRKLRYDLTAAQVKLTEAMNMLAQLGLTNRHGKSLECEKCATWFASELGLASHDANVHGGPAVPLSTVEEAA